MSGGHGRGSGPLAVAFALAAAGGAYVTLQGLLNVDVLLGPWGPWTWGALATGAVGAAVGAGRVRQALRPSTGPAPRPAAELAAGLCVLVLWVACVHLFLQPYDRFQVEVSLGVAAGGWSMVAVPLLRRGRVPARLGAALLGACLALIGAELALRVLSVVRPTPLLTSAEHSAATQLRTHRFAAGQLRYGFPCNARGFYDGPFLPRDRREGSMLAVIADSFGAGVVPHALHFTTLLESAAPGLEVYSFGVPAVGPAVYAELLEREVLPLDPDGVVVCLFVGNDLADLSTLSGVDGLLRGFLDGEHLMLRQVFRRVGALRRAGLPLVVSPVGSGGEPTVEAPEALVERWPWLIDPRREPASMTEAAYAELVVKRARFACLPQPARVRSALELVEAMARAAAPRPFAVVLIPAEFQLEDRWWRVVEAALGDQPALSRTAAQEALTAGLAERGLACLDLLPVLRAEAPLPDGDRHLYLLRDTHFNARGNRVAARALEGFLGPTLAEWRSTDGR